MTFPFIAFPLKSFNDATKLVGLLYMKVTLAAVRLVSTLSMMMPALADDGK